MMERMRRARTEDGFTLIEVLVVISILGILAGIVVFATGGLSGHGQTNACKTEKKTVSTAVEAYKSKNGSAPATEADLVTGQFLSENPSWHTVSAGAVIPDGTTCT